MKKTQHIFLIIFFFSELALNAQTFGINFDFESSTAGTYTAANAVSGWTLSSQTVTNCNTSATWTPGSPEFSVVVTPLSSLPNIGTLVNSPLGGSNVAQLNNYTANNNRTKIAQTITVSSVCTLFEFAYAGLWQDGGHSCCEQAFFKVQLRDSTGNIMPCPMYTVVTPGCSSPGTYTLQSGMARTNWQVKYIDLGVFVGQRVTIEAICSDCTHGDHYGTTFFDAACVFAYCPLCPDDDTIITTVPNIASFCPGSTSVTIYPALGFAGYSWDAPSGYPITPAQASLTALTVTNPVAGNEYTLTVNFGDYFCQSSTIYTLQTNTISISAAGASSTCAMGASGSATVIESLPGSNTYNYSWTNATNSVVGTNSVVNNLPAGIYNVSVNVPANSGCGTAVSSVTVGAAPTPLIHTIMPYCNAVAYLTSPPGSSNFQWYYNGTVAIAASLGGTASSYTVINPVNNPVYTVVYLSQQGCHDSLEITLYAVVPGTIAIVYNNVVCPGASNGQVTVTLTPSPSGQAGMHSFMITSNPGLTYSASTGPTASNIFTAGNLTANGSYDLTVSDGICVYNNTFSINPLPAFNYTVSPTTATLCSGAITVGNIQFNAPPAFGQYAYSWSPPTFLSSSTQSTIIISPTTPPGSSTTLIYTVVVTPSVANCPVTKTVSLIILSYTTPTIVPTPTLCLNSAPQTISVSPAGGTFYSNNSGNGFPVNSNTGLLNPAASLIGLNTFTYGGHCIINTAATYSIEAPFLNVSGNHAVCPGESLTLTASGADTYLWSNAATSTAIALSPYYTANYNVSGTTNSNSCSNSIAVTVTVFPESQLNITGNFSICAGETATLHVSGAQSYTWSNTSIANTIFVNPLTTTVYSVSATDSSGCAASGSIAVNAAALPSVSVTGNHPICKGEKILISGSGASYYFWDYAYIANPGQLLSPTITTVYQVKGVIGMCSDSIAFTVVVSPCTGIASIPEANDEIHIYPTLNDGNFVIEAPGQGRAIVYTLAGQLLFDLEINPGKNYVDLTHYANGIYFIKASDSSGGQMKKIIKE